MEEAEMDFDLKLEYMVVSHHGVDSASRLVSLPRELQKCSNWYLDDSTYHTLSHITALKSIFDG